MTTKRVGISEFFVIGKCHKAIVHLHLCYFTCTVDFQMNAKNVSFFMAAKKYGKVLLFISWHVELQFIEA